MGKSSKKPGKRQLFRRLARGTDRKARRHQWAEQQRQRTAEASQRRYEQRA